MIQMLSFVLSLALLNAAFIYARVLQLVPSTICMVLGAEFFYVFLTEFMKHEICRP